MWSLLPPRLLQMRLKQSKRDIFVTDILSAYPSPYVPVRSIAEQRRRRIAWSTRRWDSQALQEALSLA